MIKPRQRLSTRIRELVNRLAKSYAKARAPIGRPRWLRSLLRPSDRLLPELCANCRAAGAVVGLCAGCRADLPRNDACCRQCALPLPLFNPERAVLCGECLKHPPPFDQAFIPWRYQFPVDRMIGQYKYRQQRAFARPLLNDMAAAVETWLEERPADRPELLVAAPMHRRRERQRGFNQAAEIAETISRRTGIPWTDQALRRRWQTSAQSGLNRRQRLKNLKGVFEVVAGIPAHVAIVDDVVTTGATARTLARLLRQRGASRVQVWALARTPGQWSGSGQSFPHAATNSEGGRKPG